MNWNKRFRRAQSTVAAQRILDSKCGSYRVVESKIPGLSTRVYALLRCGDNATRMISRGNHHRTVAAAKKTCEAHARSRASA
jgi:hypothetical protein